MKKKIQQNADNFNRSKLAPGGGVTLPSHVIDMIKPQNILINVGNMTPFADGHRKIAAKSRASKL